MASTKRGKTRGARSGEIRLAAPVVKHFKAKDALVLAQAARLERARQPSRKRGGSYDVEAMTSAMRGLARLLPPSKWRSVRGDLPPAPPGQWSPFEFPDGFFPGRPFDQPRGFVRCDVNQTIAPTAESFLHTGFGSQSAHSDPGKSATGTAGAGFNFIEPVSVCHIGFISVAALPVTTAALTVTVRSALTASLFVDGGEVSASAGEFASINASSALLVLANGELVTAPEQVVLSASNSGTGFGFIDDLSGAASHELVLNIPPDAPRELVITESVDLVATASPAGHAFISGRFAWDPVYIGARGGCQVIEASMPGSWQYWPRF
jgi:hypothetical protein